jgi:hypothetical protein
MEVSNVVEESITLKEESLVEEEAVVETVTETPKAPLSYIAKVERKPRVLVLGKSNAIFKSHFNQRRNWLRWQKNMRKTRKTWEIRSNLLIFKYLIPQIRALARNSSADKLKSITSDVISHIIIL